MHYYDDRRNRVRRERQRQRQRQRQKQRQATLVMGKAAKALVELACGSGDRVHRSYEASTTTIP